jgi:hypothetical protein
MFSRSAVSTDHVRRWLKVRRDWLAVRPSADLSMKSWARIISSRLCPSVVITPVACLRQKRLYCSCFPIKPGGRARANRGPVYALALKIQVEAAETGAHNRRHLTLSVGPGPTMDIRAIAGRSAFLWSPTKRGYESYSRCRCRLTLSANEHRLTYRSGRLRCSKG